MRLLTSFLLVFVLTACGAESSTAPNTENADITLDAVPEKDSTRETVTDSRGPVGDLGSEIMDALESPVDTGDLDAGNVSEQKGSDSQSEGENDTQVSTAGLNGKSPPYDAPMEEISGVADHTGAPVGVEDLTGSWTVLWFFPKASTFG